MSLIGCRWTQLSKSSSSLTHKVLWVHKDGDGQDANVCVCVCVDNGAGLRLEMDQGSCGSITMGSVEVGAC